jgi:hypothetical protein
LENPGVDRKIIIKSIFKKQDWGIEMFIWLKMGTGGGML